MVVDTSFVIDAYNARAARHEAVSAWIDIADEELVTSPLAVAEMDHLVPMRGGDPAREALWHNLASGALAVRWWADAMTETLAISRDRPDIGLVDASLVALANRLRTDRVATLDGHFRTLTTAAGKPFTLLPDDA